MRRTEARRARSRPLAVLTVCTGNICRSPLAEQLLRARFADASIDAEVASAGLRAVVGEPMHPITAEVSFQLGGDPRGARGQQFTEAFGHAADLVLTMTRVQRDEVARLAPRASQRVFTIVEFARLLGALRGSPPTADPFDARRATIAAAAAARGTIRLTDLDDVVDPVEAPRSVHEAVGAQLALACSQIAFAMRATTVDAHLGERR